LFSCEQAEIISDIQQTIVERSMSALPQKPAVELPVQQSVQQQPMQKRNQAQHEMPSSNMTADSIHLER